MSLAATTSYLKFSAFTFDNRTLPLLTEKRSQPLSLSLLSFTRIQSLCLSLSLRFLSYLISLQIRSSGRRHWRLQRRNLRAFNFSLAKLVDGDLDCLTRTQTKSLIWNHQIKILIQTLKFEIHKFQFHKF